ncbi:MAG: transglutaminase family protein [Acidimicrobiia bacterium]
MIYRLHHETRFAYDGGVTHGYSEARLLPRATPRQRVLASHLAVDPEPDDRSEREDFFGNRVVYLGMAHVHGTLVVTAEADVEVTAAPVPAEVAWEAARAPDGQASQFTLESPLVELVEGAERYGRKSFTPGRGVLEAARELTERIHADFVYTRGVTTVLTPVSDVLARRRGVCQDFAHLEIACLRSLGLPARYVSGHLETGVGVGASHAWCSLLLPDGTWLDLDPTNRLVAPDHLTVAWGRDYTDVAPLKGIVFTEAGHHLSVSVTVRRVEGVAAGEGPRPGV